MAVKPCVLSTLLSRTTASSGVTGWRLMIVILPGMLASLITEKPAASDRWFSTASIEASWKFMLIRVFAVVGRDVAPLAPPFPLPLAGCVVAGRVVGAGVCA